MMVHPALKLQRRPTPRLRPQDSWRLPKGGHWCPCNRVPLTSPPPPPPPASDRRPCLLSVRVRASAAALPTRRPPAHTLQLRPLSPPPPRSAILSLQFHREREREKDGHAEGERRETGGRRDCVRVANRVVTTVYLRGLPLMTSATFLESLTPLPPCLHWGLI